MEKKSTALIKTNVSPWTAAQVKLITRTVAKGATIDELHLFLYTAKKVGLDPLAKQIHFLKHNTKDGPQMTIITGIDGYLAIAERTKQLAGIDDAIFDDGFKYEPGKEPTNPSKATVTVYRMVENQKVGFTATARWREYKPADNKDFMWRKMPYNQLAKCALALALRKAFPNDLSGIRTEEEIAQAQEVLPEENLKNAETPKVVEQPKEKEGELDSLRDKECEKCGVKLTVAEANFSKKMYKKLLCRECQKGEKK